jgi:hypothetical protein
VKRQAGIAECGGSGAGAISAYAVHGSWIPHPSKSDTFRVAMAAPRDAAIAAIWASACEIGRPARRRAAAIGA